MRQSSEEKLNNLQKKLDEVLYEKEDLIKQIETLQSKHRKKLTEDTSLMLQKDGIIQMLREKNDSLETKLKLAIQQQSQGVRSNVQVTVWKSQCGKMTNLLSPKKNI